jgi:hypothetical protein
MICIPQDPTGRLILQTTIGVAASIGYSQGTLPVRVGPHPEGTASRAVATGYCFAPASVPPAAPLVVLGLR